MTNNEQITILRWIKKQIHKIKCSSCTGSTEEVTTEEKRVSLSTVCFCFSCPECEIYLKSSQAEDAFNQDDKNLYFITSYNCS